MDARKIKPALADVTAEQAPTIKRLKLASLCSALWAERGVELVVVVGSAIEILTEGAYASGDLDLCHTTAATLPIRQRQDNSARWAARATGRWPGCLWTCSGRRKILRPRHTAVCKRSMATCW